MGRTSAFSFFWCFVFPPFSFFVFRGPARGLFLRLLFFFFFHSAAERVAPLETHLLMLLSGGSSVKRTRMLQSMERRRTEDRFVSTASSFFLNGSTPRWPKVADLLLLLLAGAPPPLAAGGSRTMGRQSKRSCRALRTRFSLRRQHFGARCPIRSGFFDPPPLCEGYAGPMRLLTQLDLRAKTRTPASRASASSDRHWRLLLLFLCLLAPIGSIRLVLAFLCFAYFFFKVKQQPSRSQRDRIRLID